MVSYHFEKNAGSFMELPPLANASYALIPDKYRFVFV
jgi:hypothetical protein